MAESHEGMRRMCRDLVGSLVSSSKRTTLCLNIEEEGFAPLPFVIETLGALKQTGVKTVEEPSAADFTQLLAELTSGTTVVGFEDLDQNAKALEALLEHVKKPPTGGKLIVVSRHWHPRSKAKERELRKSCLFYTQSFAPPPKEKTR